MGVDGSDGGRGDVDRLTIKGLTDGCGVRIDDRIERRHCEIRTGEAVEPEPLEENPFRYPVDTAVGLRTGHLAFEGFSRTFVQGRDSDTEVGHFESRSFEPGSYQLELSGPVKLYCAVEGPMDVETTVTDLEVSLRSAGEVRLGARSYHDRPAATVTTTDDPVDAMAAVSTFGSALKTTRSERSYPTLRGHPPALELGDELSIPPGLEPPAADVRIEVPPSLQDVMVVSPLAYYLGARVVEGDEPRLVVDGESVPLEDGPGFETAVERALKKTFLLDCLVRTAGPRSVQLHERAELEPVLDVDLADLYGRPGPERLRAYADVPYETVAGYVPTWKLTASVEPVEESLEVLPFLVADLAVVRSPTGISTTTATPFAGTDGGSPGGAPVESTPRTAEAVDDPAGHHVQPEPYDSLEQAWVGSGTPVGASKALPEAYRNRLDRTAREEEIEIVVVCNDEEMLNERDGVEAVYGTREEFPVDVALYEDLTTDRLRFLLESDVDFFHYIGHVDADGFRCTDGKLDASTLGDVAVDIFFLNACGSYQQGRRLIEKGAIAGVVTLDEVINSGAIRIGRTLAELLEYGFPLRSALNVARDRSIVGSQYLVIGDGNADIAQAQSGCALLADVTRGEEGYELAVSTYPPRERGMGTQFRPALECVDDVYLCPGTLPTFDVSRATLEDYFSKSVLPVRLDGEFTWSDRISLSDRER
jgi:hypothetical protein